MEDNVKKSKLTIEKTPPKKNSQNSSQKVSLLKTSREEARVREAMRVAERRAQALKKQQIEEKKKNDFEKKILSGEFKHLQKKFL